ncbi:MAG: Tn3 family transposase [Chloroflexota bacterium]|nr:Tn3 family transposase [Chloroflexota bacterium]
MTAIERTAYPRLKRNPSAPDLAAAYTPTEAELAWVRRTVRDGTHRLHLLIWLKCFQCLGYFPDLLAVPGPIIEHLHGCLGVDLSQPLGYRQDRMLYRHHQAVRAYLRVQPFDDAARTAASAAIQAAAAVMDNPADLINVAMEELIRLRYELPAFSTLEHLVENIRTAVNNGLFAQVQARWTPEEVARWQALLTDKIHARRTNYQTIKDPPESATLGHLRAHERKLAWLGTLADTDRLLAGLPTAKRRHWAAEARALDAGAMNEIEPPKRYVILLCLIEQARVATRDEVITMFVKRMSSIQQAAQDELVKLRESHLETTLKVAGTLAAMLDTLDPATEANLDSDSAPCRPTPAPDDPAQATALALAADAALVQQLRDLVSARGGTAALREDCTTVTSYNGRNYLPLCWRAHKSHRATLLRMVRSLSISSTTQDQSLCQALAFVLANSHKRSEWLPDEIDLTFASAGWQHLIIDRRKRKRKLARRHLEVCVFLTLAADLKNGDACVAGSEDYADYRAHLLPWEQCAPQVAEYCRELGFAPTAGGFVAGLKDWLTKTAEAVDRAFPANKRVSLDAKKKISIKRGPRRPVSPTLEPLRELLEAKMPERRLLDIMRNVEHWTNWSRHFGPLSGSDSRLDRDRYVLTAFTYGTNLGPNQMVRHLRGQVSAHQLSTANHRHITADRLNKALRDVINRYASFALPQVWGKANVAAADGTQYPLYANTLKSEYHIRYGDYGGIAYRHLSDMYIALFSHFIVCGVWEAVYILDLINKNTSDIQPDTIHADTQGQNLPVFGMAYLLGIKLMPRIRNWKDLIFYRPSKGTKYTNIDSLFTDVIDWQLIETHWQDLLQVVLSIKAGKVLPSTLLRKLTNYSHKNRLYQAFRELGRVVRTEFLLRCLADPDMRDGITAVTNKLESYHGFAKWASFGHDGVLPDKQAHDQEKRIKYNDLVANAVILQNTVDLTHAIRELVAEGHEVKVEDLAAISPYWTAHIKRFGDYVLDWENLPPDLDEELALPLLTKS